MNYIKSMLVALFAALLVAPVATAVAAPPTPTINAPDFTDPTDPHLPPVQFRSSKVKPTILFAHPDVVNIACRPNLGHPIPPGSRIIACAAQTGKDQGVLIMPDPCLYAETDWYAYVLCHENAHISGEKGWRH
ncbi:hypothetical protein [Croceicoccus naphthovorans]|uniref:hypothetical protein n=1 Tax=Croceicoccus naphthovorans TaxID=1348774 RepID=UPI00069FD856|nr:hypothetical protein [Croceicoccus naphthovorans]MBB3990303.1 hypothetical protein [Croceicoccus naphthovorans]